MTHKTWHLCTMMWPAATRPLYNRNSPEGTRDPITHGFSTIGGAPKMLLRDARFARGVLGADSPRPRARNAFPYRGCYRRAPHDGELAFETSLLSCAGSSQSTRHTQPARASPDRRQATSAHVRGRATFRQCGFPSSHEHRLPHPIPPIAERRQHQDWLLEELGHRVRQP